MPSATRQDWLKKKIRYRESNDVLRALTGVVRNWLTELETTGGPAKRDKNSAVSLLRTQVQAQQLQPPLRQQEIWPGREAPHGHAPDRLREEDVVADIERRIRAIPTRLSEITLRWDAGKWFLYAPVIEGFDRERQITVRRLVKIISDLEDEWATLEAEKASNVRARLQEQLDNGWAVMQITRRGSRIYGLPVLTHESATGAVDSLFYAIQEGRLAYEDALRGEYIVAPINWLDWSKGLDPETTAEIIDWLALLRRERRAFIGIDPDDIDRLSAAAVRAVKETDPSILTSETRTTGGALWQR